MRVLVTGATGFIGQRMVRLLVRECSASQVCCLVKPSEESKEVAGREVLRKLGLRMIVGDLNRTDVSDEAPPEYDLLFHIAAETSTSLPEPALRVNDQGIDHLMDWLKPRSRGTRLIYTSTVGAMDRDGPATTPLNEDSPCVPRTAYGLTKLRGEAVVRERAARDGFTWTTLRLPTVYGPGQMRGGLFDRMMTLTSSGSILGRLDWPGKTSVIYVDDLVAVAWTLARAQDAANQLYCVASDEALTVAEVAQAIGRETGHPVPVIVLPRWVWRLGSFVAWNRALWFLLAPVARIPHWRLGILIDHGFWFDTGKLRRIYAGPLRNVPEGMRALVAETGPTATVV